MGKNTRRKKALSKFERFNRHLTALAPLRKLAPIAAALAALLLADLSIPSPAFAREQAWVRGEIRLNVRSGPGTQYRILGGVATGDGLTILARAEGWTQIELKDDVNGWIPVGYLKPEPPPTVRLAQLEVETKTLRSQVQTTSSEIDKLRSGNEALSVNDSLQRAEIDRLVLDNTKLRAGARYPEMIAGASILVAGMILGALLHKSSSSRRPTSRIRL